MEKFHVPVLLEETIKYLDVRPGEKYIDATIGGGGHTRALLDKGAIVLGIDQDQEAISFNERDKRQWIKDKRLFLVHRNFAHLKEIAVKTGFHPVRGVLFDLGVSSHQLETGYRGFSFARGVSAKLDMRMDPEEPIVTAADLIRAGSERELAGLIWKYGEERAARAIAKAIVAERRKVKELTTDWLAKVILSVRRKAANDRTHPATRTFQALRMAVNDELGNLEAALPQAAETLSLGGRLVVISFHSLEDRIVKNFLRTNANGNIQMLTNEPVTPTEEEVARNPRARSAKMRVAVKKA